MPCRREPGFDVDRHVAAFRLGPGRGHALELPLPAAGHDDGVKDRPLRLRAGVCLQAGTEPGLVEHLPGLRIEHAAPADLERQPPGAHDCRAARGRRRREAARPDPGPSRSITSRSTAQTTAKRSRAVRRRRRPWSRRCRRPGSRGVPMATTACAPEGRHENRVPEASQRSVSPPDRQVEDRVRGRKLATGPSVELDGARHLRRRRPKSG